MYNAQVANPKKNQSTNSTGTKWLLTSYGKVADQWSPRISLSQNWFIPLIVCLPKLIKGFFHSMYVIPDTDKYMHSSIFLFSFSLSLSYPGLVVCLELADCWASHEILDTLPCSPSLPTLAPWWVPTPQPGVLLWPSELHWILIE